MYKFLYSLVGKYETWMLNYLTRNMLLDKRKKQTSFWFLYCTVYKTYHLWNPLNDARGTAFWEPERGLGGLEGIRKSLYNPNSICLIFSNFKFPFANYYLFKNIYISFTGENQSFHQEKYTVHDNVKTGTLYFFNIRNQKQLQYCIFPRLQFKYQK